MIETKAGKYITGYQNNSAFSAPKKDNEFTRGISKQVERKEIGGGENFFFFFFLFLFLPSLSFFFFHILFSYRPFTFPPFLSFLPFLGASAYGIREPSLFARNFPDFDVCYGEFIEFFHKLKHVTPSTFWKKHVFVDYKGEPPLWVMSKRDRETFRQRISNIVPTHDIGRKPLDPNTEKMKGSGIYRSWFLSQSCRQTDLSLSLFSLPFFLTAEDWDIFVVTTSPLAQGLLDPKIYEIWDHFRQGYMIHLSKSPLTTERRQEAKKHWAQFAIKCEALMPITMMTVATHLVAVEADHQIEYSGKLQESMSSWIERLCGNLVEETRRRRICFSPETTMIRSFLLKHYLKCHEHLLPKILEEEKVLSALYDQGSNGIQVSGNVWRVRGMFV